MFSTNYFKKLAKPNIWPMQNSTLAMPLKEATYASLSQTSFPPDYEKEVETEPQPVTVQVSLWFRVAVLFSLAASIVAISLALFSTAEMRPQPSQEQCANTQDPLTSATISTAHRMKCGASVEEAISLNCSYDHLSHSWLPDYCPRDFNEEFIAESLGPNGWTYYKYHNGTVPMTIDELSRIGPGVCWYSTNLEHIVHCKYMMMRLHRAFLRALEGNVTVDETMRVFHHTEHCMGILHDNTMTAEIEQHIGTNGDVAFGRC